MYAELREKRPHFMDEQPVLSAPRPWNRPHSALRRQQRMTGKWFGCKGNSLHNRRSRPSLANWTHPKGWCKLEL